MDTIPFGERLLDLLERVQPPRTQAWLAAKSGIPASTISRMLKGDRNPTPDVIESLAPVLGVEPLLLVAGTDAESRFKDSGDWIRKGNYEAAVRKLVEYETRLNDADIQARTATDAHERECSRRADLERQLSQAHLDLDRRRWDIEDLRDQDRRLQDQGRQLRSDLRRYQEGLYRAVTEVASLRAGMSSLAEELSSTKKSSRASTILAGVAAFTGVVTVAHFLVKDGGKDDEGPPAPDGSPQARGQ
jgi:transcriptional regulator with XRE-family HTH domain